MDCCSSISSNSNSHPYGRALGRADRTADGRSADETSPAQRLLAMNRASNTDLTLSIQTKEGDTVTISVDHEVDSSKLLYGAPGRGAGQPDGVQARSRSVTDSLQIQVNGTLSDDEMADVKALIQRVIAALGGGASTTGGTSTTSTGASDGTTSGDATTASGAGTSTPATTPGGTSSGDATTASGAGTSTPANVDPTDTLAGFSISITRSQTFDVVKIGVGGPSGPRLAPTPQPLAPAPAGEGAPSGAPVVGPGPTTTDSTPATSGAPTSATSPTTATAPTTAPAWLLDLLRVAAGGWTTGAPITPPISLTPGGTTA